MTDKSHRIKAIEMRKLGKSYSEISKYTGVPKSTLSGWFSKYKWSDKVTKRLNQKYAPINRNRVRQMNIARSEEMKKRHQMYQNEARLTFPRLAKNPLFVAGTSIYWGEGDKVTNSRVSVINSDVRLLGIVKRYYLEVLRIPQSKLRAGLFIYADHNKDELLEFWSKSLKLPKNQFVKTQILPSRSINTKKRLANGVCSLYFSSKEFDIKISTWIDLLADSMRE